MSVFESIYLDYAATTPADPRVVEAMLAYLGPEACFANPSSGHGPGHGARAAVETARADVARLINATPEEILWTSGATEAINLALKGIVRSAGVGGPAHIVTCATEHAATLDTCAALAREGVQVTTLRPDGNGHLSTEAIAEAIRAETVLVSVMHVNNETGIIHDIGAVGALTRSRGVALHVDAAQGAGRLPVDVVAMQVDLMSLNAHKLCGPKGVGALYVRADAPFEVSPQLHGGGQERRLRPGTLPTHQIVGMGTACRLVAEEREADAERAKAFRAQLLSRVATLPGFALAGGGPCVPGIVNLRFDGIDANELMTRMAHIACSAGAACATDSIEPSHVLTAIGLDAEQASRSLRLSFGRFSSADDITAAADAIEGAMTSSGAFA